MLMRLAMVGVSVWLLNFVVAAQENQDIPKDLLPFQGMWKVIEATRGGVAAPKELVAEMKFQFEGSKVTVFEKTVTKDGQFIVDSRKDPAEIDLISSDEDKTTGRVVKSLGIYQFDKDGKLIIVFQKGSDTARPKTFDDKTATRLVLEKMKK
jgi:uncharacterized protein (TIGR03067 family)